MVKINDQIENFTVNALKDGAFSEVSLSDYKGKWVVLFFYPADFTFVCPTELGELADYHEQFKAEGAEILSISTDTEFVHHAWKKGSDTIAKVKYPMLADPTGKVSKYFGVYIEDAGLALRGTFVIDPDGVLKLAEINDLGIGRSSSELLRKLRAAKFVREHGYDVCPASWEPGKDTLKPGIDLVGAI